MVAVYGVLYGGFEVAGGSALKGYVEHGGLFGGDYLLLIRALFKLLVIYLHFNQNEF